MNDINISKIIYQKMIFCNTFYDSSIVNFMDEFMETNLQTKNREEFVIECINELNHYSYSENDYTIIDKYNLVRYLTKYYSPDEIFKSMNGKKAAELINELNEIEFIEEMLSDSINLEDMLCFYYIAFVHHNKDNIIKYLLRWLE